MLVGNVDSVGMLSSGSGRNMMMALCSGILFRLGLGIRMKFC